MSEPKWTPGPWETIKHSWECTGIYSGDQFTRFAYRVAVAKIDDDVTEDNQDEFEITMDANARLIAAAPELFEALVEAIAELNACCEEIDEESYNNPKFNAIIAKAKGEVP